MSVVNYVRCDGPDCAAVTPEAAMGDPWVVVSSTAHQRPDHTAALGSRAVRAAYYATGSGRITLHLCGEHADAFDEHRPATDGSPGGGVDAVRVRCSCGWSARPVGDVITVGPAPRRLPERTWWSHLPAELQGYATRNEVAP